MRPREASTRTRRPHDRASPARNRVTPLGEIEAFPLRGAWTGVPDRCLPRRSSHVGSADDGLETAEQASSLDWVRTGGCALSIGVSPDNTIWVVGCDTPTSRTIWSMLYATPPGELVSEEVWTPRQGTGRSVSVDNAGLAHPITTAGQPMIAVIPDTAPHVVAEPTGTFKQEPSNSPCLRDFDMYHLDNLLASHTSNRPVAFHDHHLFAVRCPTDRGNGIVMTRFGEDSQWTATDELATQIALFNPGNAATRALVLWTLNSDGVLKRFDESTRQVTTATAPPYFTYGLTEHFALTDGGVYQYSDSNDSWRVGRCRRIIDSSICVAVMTIFPLPVTGPDRRNRRCNSPTRMKSSAASVCCRSRSRGQHHDHTGGARPSSLPPTQPSA